MQQSQIVAHFQAQADRLIAGKLEGFGEMFSLPLPIHFPDGMTIVFDQAGGDALLGRMHAELVASGTVAARPEISAVELPKDGRFRVWIDWKAVNAAGVEVRGSSIIYYCRKCPTGLRTEMVQYTQVAARGIVADQALIARSA